MRNGVSRLLVVSACAVGFAASLPATASAGPAPASASPASSSPNTGTAASGSWSFQSALSPTSAGGEKLTGASWVTVTGSRAELKIQVQGLLEGAPHPQMLFVGGKGGCPAPLRGNGDTAARGTAGLGSIGLAVTTSGTTTPGAAPADMAFPTAGSYTYARTVEVGPDVVAGIANGKAALVVYGVDLNNNGRLDGGVVRSELGAGLTTEAATPALCGTYTPMQMTVVPDGGADTGGGSTASAAATMDEGQGWGEVAAGLSVVGLSLLGVAGLTGRRRVRAR